MRRPEVNTCAEPDPKDVRTRPVHKVEVKVIGQLRRVQDAIRRLAYRAQLSSRALQHLPARTTNRLPPLNTSLKIEYIMHVFLKLIVQALVILERQIVELAFPGLGECDCTSRNMMSFSERNLAKVRY